MTHPEKADVNIYKLFHWGKPFDIVDRYNNFLVTAYIRLVGDADLQRARVFAIRKSAELRKKLKTEDTDERLAFISSIYELEEKSDIIDYLVLLNTKRFTQDAVKNVKITNPREPKSDAPLEEFEKYQAEVDSYEDRRSTAIHNYVTTLLEQLRKDLEGKEIEQLRRMYERIFIDELCEREMINTYRAVCVFYGTFKDEDFKERMFETFEDFNNLPTEIKNQYLEYYDDLEINVDELKKLQGATQ